MAKSNSEVFIGQTYSKGWGSLFITLYIYMRPLILIAAPHQELISSISKTYRI
jgi:hypothetical protein